MDCIKLSLITLFLAFLGISYGQQVVIDNSISAQSLIENNLIQGCIEVSNISSPVNGSTVGLTSFGYFQRGASNFPFEDGIVLTTGDVLSAGNGINNATLNEGNENWGSDADLESTLGITGTLNATSIEFDVISISNTIQFNYILASEEYFANFPCDYSDGFAFLIREAGTNSPYVNIALVPGTSTPVNTTTVHDEIVGFCEASNEQFFDGYNLGDTNFNGRTTVLSATAAIQPNVQYQIKLVIADQNDQNYDSAVFIQGNSFNASVNLGEDLTTCAPEAELDGNIYNPNASYSWYFNNTLIEGSMGPTYIATQSGSYRVEIEIPLAGGVCVIEDDINLELNSTQSSVLISDYELCDDLSNDGIEVFDLSTKDDEILSLVPISNYVISYHYSLTEAESGINDINNPIQNTSNPQIIHVRIEDVTNGCLLFSTVNLIVNNVPIINEPTPLVVCDDQEADGFTPIDLTVKNDEITDSQNNLLVNYHATENDAIAGANPLPMPYVNTNPNEVVYVSVLNQQTGCRGITTLTIEVSEIPTIDRSNHYIDACDSDYDGFAQFNLTDVIPDVIGNLTGVSVTFHETNEDALNGVNAIANDTNYSNIIANEQIVYIRIENDATGCASVTPIEIHTNMLLTATNLDDVSICDIDNDGEEEIDFGAIASRIMRDIPDITIEFYETETDRDNGVNAIDQSVSYNSLSNPQIIYLRLSSPTCTDVADIQIVLNPIQEFSSVGTLTVCDDDQDGLTTIDLSNFDDLVTGGASGYNVTYFLTEADAEDNTNALPNLYDNSSNPFTLYPRIASDETGCAAINSFMVEVLLAPESSTPNNIIICDADRDGVSVVNLSTSVSEALSQTEDRTVSLHNSLSDANSDINAISNITNYQAQTETIYIRIENDNTGCYSVEELLIIVNTLPYVGTVNNEMSAYNICENESDGIGEFFFLTKDAEALDGQTGKNVSYYLSESEANTKTNPINKENAFENSSNPQTIYIRVENDTDESCYMTSSFTIEVGTNPEFNEPTNWFVCDDMSNDGQETFNLSAKIEEIQAGFPDIQNITFYANETDAINGTEPLPLNFTNTVNPQQIYVQIDNGTICNSISSFVLNVIQVPTVNPTLALVVCDDNYDAIVTVNLTDVDIDILDVRQDDIEIEYYETIEDAELNQNSINDPNNYTTSSITQTVYVKVTNTVSDCYTVVPIDIIVNLPPIITDFVNYNICANDDNFFDLNEISAFAVNNMAGIEFSYFSSETDAISNNNALNLDYTYQSNSDILYLRAQFTETGCFIVYQFNLIVNTLPTANQPNDLIVCDDDFDGLFQFDLNLQNTTVLGNQDASGLTVSYHNSMEDADTGNSPVDVDYFAFDGEIIYVRLENNSTGCYDTTEFNVVINPLPIIDIGDQVICLNNLPLLVSANTNNASDSYQWSTGETSPEIVITTIGTYWVRITSEFGCENMETFEVIESEAATIEATEIIDFSDPNNITVTISGIGNYLYQLDGGVPQESNVFNNVSMGYHTITIIDLNGCAQVTKDVLVVDVPKFMTPNNDGYFDTWHIVGIETLPGTVIHIFDRYGKLVKVISADTPGWDGTYNGTKLPSSDYWFVADIKRGDQSFQIKGHFTIKR
jgi:gliding motility-associated-like protein